MCYVAIKYLFDLIDAYMLLYNESFMLSYKHGQINA